MSERAVSSAWRLGAGVRPLKPDHGDIWNALDELYTLQAETASKVGDLVAVIGAPGVPEGGQPPTGIFAHLSSHNNRISKFERLWERGLGFGAACVCIAGPLIGILWWLAGDRVSHLLHG